VGGRRAAEADGVLQMLLWLNRTPESFLSDHQEFEDVGARLPVVQRDQVLRFDSEKLYGALEALRAQRNMTWTQVACEVRLGVSSLIRLSKGGRTGFPDVMRIVRWLGRPAAEFTRASDL